MQRDLSELALPTLYDLLATYTGKFTLMMRAGSPTGEFRQCEEFIVKLQTEIETRRIRETQDSKNDSELMPVPS